MSLGLRMAAEALGYAFVPKLAADFEPAALGVYSANLDPDVTYPGDLAQAVEFELDSTSGGFARKPRLRDVRFRRLVGEVDVLIGGPPCQGHSDLNNHSRRADPKNSLYLLMPAFACALNPRIVIIENVPAVVHDHFGVVEKTISMLSSAGYSVSADIAPTMALGVAQRRRRHVLVAIKGTGLDLQRIWASFGTSPRSVRWAISDLASMKGETTFDTSSLQSDANVARINWLHDEDEFDLPNEQRPVCHQSDDHTYKSMYGRIRPNEPAQTITSGFGSPGQGRYVHPTRRRTLTPHEAARLQFFPDFFAFENGDLAPRRTQLAVMIGNAVPPKLSYVVGLAALAAAYT